MCDEYASGGTARQCRVVVVAVVAVVVVALQQKERKKRGNPSRDQLIERTKTAQEEEEDVFTTLGW